MIEGFLNSYGYRIHYVHWKGKGPKILLIHSMGMDGHSMDKLAESLKEQYEILSLTILGHGDSDSPTTHLPLDEHSEIMRNCYKKLKFYPNVLIGHSVGGTIALSFGAQYPERLSHLVTVAAHIYLEEKMEPGIEGLRQLYEDKPKFREALRREHGDKVEDVFYGWYGGWREEENLDWDMRPSLKHITCPVLVVQGLDDEHATPQHARDIAAQIKDAELWLVPGAGHMLPQDNSTEFNNRLLDFSQECHANERQSVVS